MIEKIKKELEELHIKKMKLWSQVNDIRTQEMVKLKELETIRTSEYKDK